MATKSEKNQWNQLPKPWRNGGLFRNINNDLIIARQIGFVFDEAQNNWYILVDGVKYWGQDNSITDEQWGDPYRTLGDKNGNNDPIFVFNSKGGGIKKKGTYVINIDANGDQYYVDDLGRRIYGYNPGQNPQADAFIDVGINENLSTLINGLRDTNDVVFDILDVPILPKTPEVGLYSTKQYFEELSKKKEQYRSYNKTKDATILVQRAKDIVVQQNSLINDLNSAGASIKKENFIIGTALAGFGFVAGKQAAGNPPKQPTGVLSLLASVGLGNPVGIGVAVAGVMIKYAAAQTTGRREKLRTQDVLELEDELNAISQILETSGSSDTGGGNNKKIWLWVGGVALAILIVYLATRKN